MEALADPIVIIDRDGNVEFLNRSAENLTGRSLGGARGRPLAEVLPLTSEADGASLGGPIAESLRTGAPTGPLEAVLVAGPGRTRALDVTVAPIRGASGAVTGAAVVARDMSHARAVARQLAHEATHDALTGLVNRAEFERRLERALASARAEGAEHAVCFLDLDGFKKVNDRCGHAAGDELLAQLSAMLPERIRGRDTVARLGGDEFGILLEHCSAARAARIANGVRKAVRAYRFTHGAETHAVGASIGVVPVRAGSGTAADLIHAADTACYLAKCRGRNRIQLYDPERGTAEPWHDYDWVQRARRALAQDHFRLYAQPIVPLAGAGGAPGLEVLLRLCPDGEPLLPGALLPAAERYGLVPVIDAPSGC